MLTIKRIGDFYEAFGDDAVALSRLAGCTLTTRTFRATGKQEQMAGFPYHQLDAYTAKIVASGQRVAVIEPVA